MDLKKWNANAAANPPSVPASLSDGYPTDGDPSSGVEASTPGAYLFYQVLTEMHNFLDAAGIVPNHTSLSQLLAAFRALNATEAEAGTVKLATAAEAQAFTANKFLDAAKLALAFQGGNQTIANNGYQKLPGGMILQWGRETVPIGSSVAVTFPISFPAAIRAAYTTGQFGSGGSTTSFGVHNLSLSGMSLYLSNASNNLTGYWLAIGN